MNRFQRIGFGILIVALFAFVPFWKVVVVPEWTINVVDETGRPKQGVEVRQHWNHYSFSDLGIEPPYGDEESRVSNSEGQIAFPERSFRASPFRIGFAFIGTPLRWINPHSSTGPSSHLICLNADCGYAEPTYNGRHEELEKNVIVVRSEE